MALIQINWNPSQRELRQFGAIWLPLSFVMIGAIAFYKFDCSTLAAIACGFAAVIAPIGFLFPAAMKPIFVGWMIAAFPIGWTISHVLLAVIFYLVITPIGGMLRLFGYDSMHRRFDRSAKTYWVPHATDTDPKRYFRQF